ncbi:MULTISPECIES: LysR family transcriptional regulator [Vibrio]|uniref:LysR family transcriptional regulator n=1 Tax=Vibrio TaxID=662 RepID=UPI00207657ED|nr:MULTISPECIES: LysR family transcriptional regulator [Vibrio]MCY9851640.1 LysR family transcriptional regulator [Vibrio mediterranei]MDA0109549.1 LysR family transcriptional regulator [Vibrio sp. La 4.2.2]USE01132.1 LysR family transcriptional regulator [Vibrio sp. SCSIO 43133]
MSETGREKIDWKRIDLNLLIVFFHLYQTRSVSVAAEKSFVSQSAMSHSLSKLRTLCGDRLFERKGHQMVPTERAAELYPTVEQILNLVQFNVLPTEQFLAKNYRGICKIGLTDYAEFIFAPTIYDAIVSQAPGAKVSFINVNRHNYRSVSEQENLDIIIGSIPDLEQQFSAQKLYTEKHVCIYDSSLVKVGELDIETFASLPHCLVSPEGNFTSNVDKQLESIGLSREVTAVSRNFLTIGRLVTGREMFAIVPEKMAKINLIQTNLTSAPPPVPVADFDISMIWKKQSHMSDKIHWLKDTIYEAILSSLHETTL